MYIMCFIVLFYLSWCLAPQNLQSVSISCVLDQHIEHLKLACIDSINI